MALNIQKDKGVFQLRTEKLVTNRVLGKELKAYLAWLDAWEEVIEEVDKIEARMFGWGLLLVVGIGFYWEYGLYLFLGLVVGFLLLKKPARKRKALLEQKEKALRRPGFAYLYQRQAHRNKPFIRFLAEAVDECMVYRMDEEPLYQPKVPKGMTFEWEYLLEKDGEYCQIAWSGWRDVVNYVVYPVDPARGRVLDSDIQTVFKPA